jgi:hypothetical protein
MDFETHKKRERTVSPSPQSQPSDVRPEKKKKAGAEGPTVSRYWSDEGKYQKEFDALTEKLIPPSGKSTTIAGEAIRAANRLLYEYHNDGWGRNVSGTYFYLYQFFDKYGVDFDEFAYLEDPSLGRYDDENDVTEATLIDQMIDHVYTVVAVTHPQLQFAKNSEDMWSYQQSTPPNSSDEEESDYEQSEEEESDYEQNEEEESDNDKE